MGFLIGEIIAFLAGAALIGLFIGWALFGGKKPAPANAGDTKASKEALKKAETRIKELEAECDGSASNLNERDDEIAQLRHQIAQTEQYRVETAGKIDQLKTQARVLQEQLKERDAELALAGGGAAPGTGVALAELTQQLEERGLELKKLQVKYDELKTAVGPEAPTVTDLRAQVSELRAVIESGVDVPVGDDGEQVTRLRDRNAKLSEENLGLKAAYEAAERSLEEQDGAMDQLSQVLLKSQQEAAQLKQELATMKAQAGRSSERGVTFPPPIPTTPAATPLAAEDTADEEDATRAIPVFDLDDDDDDEEEEEAPTLPEIAPPTPVDPSLPTPVVEEAEPEEATMALPAFDLPDAGPPQLPPAASDDEEEAEEATVAMPVFDLDEDTEVDTTMVAGAAAEPVGDDDLKLIKGIGPAIEKRIKGAGIATWAQLASLDQDGVESLANEIKVSVKKILKDAWVEQARELQAEG